MKDLNTVLTELIKLETIASIDKGCHQGVLIEMSSSLSHTNQKEILDILSGYKWSTYSASSKQEYMQSSVTYIIIYEKAPIKKESRDDFQAS